MCKMSKSEARRDAKTGAAVIGRNKSERKAGTQMALTYAWKAVDGNKNDPRMSRLEAYLPRLGI